MLSKLAVPFNKMFQLILIRKLSPLIDGGAGFKVKARFFSLIFSQSYPEENSRGILTYLL